MPKYKKQDILEGT